MSVFWVGFSYWAWVLVIDAFIESRCVTGKGYLKEGYPVSYERIRIESYSECESFVDVQLL